MTTEERIQDIRDHPENHRHTFDRLHSCCVVDGVVNLALMEAHQKYCGLGKNGGVQCDAISGPCACGGWH